ncbi:phosphotransferase family protein [Bauldia sp.]|uniref:phosphotransferase family protein n=1 Tax=Bauldia sp. TaxID=2575872 RepID=UPI003BA9B6C3
MLGEGSESEVYALDDERVVRVPRSVPIAVEPLHRRKAFLDRIAGALPFRTPEIETIAEDGVTIEKRLPGRPMTDALRTVHGEPRRRALRSYFEAAAAVSDLPWPDTSFGLLLAETPITAEQWTTFLAVTLDQRAEHHAAHLRATFGDLEGLLSKAHDLLRKVPGRPRKVLAHGDIFPGNIMLDADMNVSAILDFGAWTLVAEPHYDIAGAVMFAEVTTECVPEDGRYLRVLLAERCGDPLPPAFAFYRAYFAFTLFDPNAAEGLYPKLQPWNIATLGQLRDGTITDWLRLPR